MSSDDQHQHVDLSEGDRPVASADVTTSPDQPGVARISLRAESGHLAPGSRSKLVDEVMDLPEVAGSSRLEASVPLGDGESLDRLRERTDEAATRPAGASALLDASIPPGHPAPPPDPATPPED